MNQSLVTHDPTLIDQARMERICLLIDLDNFIHNYELLSEAYSPSRIMPVLKGDAYGLGALEFINAFQSLNTPCHHYAVDNVAEGIAIRDRDFHAKILVIDGDTAENSSLALKYNLTPGIPHEHLLAAYLIAAEVLGICPDIWLVANVGFNRSGYDDLTSFLKLVDRAEHSDYVTIRGIYGHMSNAAAQHPCNSNQINKYFLFHREASVLVGRKLESSLFATHGIPRWTTKYPTDWLRPGLLLYGEHFYDQEVELPSVIEELKPVISLQAKVIGILPVTQDDFIGYGRTNPVVKGQVLANVAGGFSTGLPSGNRLLSVIVDGHKTTTIGARGMDAFMIDITDIPGVKIGDWVTIIGTSGKLSISVHQMTRQAGLSPYELLSNFNIIPKQYTHGNSRPD